MAGSSDLPRDGARIGQPHEEMLARSLAQTGDLGADDRARLREEAAHAAAHGTPCAN